jgi:hypothetical protein
MRLVFGIEVCCCALLFTNHATALVPHFGVSQHRLSPQSPSSSQLPVALSQSDDGMNLDGNVDSRSFIKSSEDINPIIRLGKGEKVKLINAFGLWCMVVSFFTGPIWMLAMKIVGRMGENDENRALYDKTGKIWAKTWLTMTNSYPTVSGNLDRLKEDNNLGACLYVANHASWLDIPVLCTVLNPVFKFISKAELAKVPCIGMQLVGVRT